jgi:hypothetical protein
MRTAWSLFAVVMLACFVAACGGDSKEEKAQDKVCDARASISKQVDTLKALTPATVTTDAVTKSLQTIRNDLSDIADARSDLNSDRRSEVEAANQAYAGSVRSIASQVVTSLSASDAKAALVTSLQQLATSYDKAFSRVKCD